MIGPTLPYGYEPMVGVAAKDNPTLTKIGAQFPVFNVTPFGSNPNVPQVVPTATPQAQGTKNLGLLVLIGAGLLLAFAVGRR